MKIPYNYLGFTSADTKGLMKNHSRRRCPAVDGAVQSIASPVAGLRLYAVVSDRDGHARRSIARCGRVGVLHGTGEHDQMV